MLRRLDPPDAHPLSAYAWEDWAKKEGLELIKAPQSIKKGDVVIYSFSHIGIAATDSAGGSFTAIEGNTDAAGDREGGAVLRKTRKLSLVRSVIRM